MFRYQKLETVSVLMQYSQTTKLTFSPVCCDKLLYKTDRELIRIGDRSALAVEK